MLKSSQVKQLSWPLDSETLWSGKTCDFLQKSPTKYLLLTISAKHKRESLNCKKSCLCLWKTVRHNLTLTIWRRFCTLKMHENTGVIFLIIFYIKQIDVLSAHSTSNDVTHCVCRMNRIILGLLIVLTDSKLLRIRKNRCNQLLC